MTVISVCLPLQRARNLGSAFVPTVIDGVLGVRLLTDRVWATFKYLCSVSAPHIAWMYQSVLRAEPPDDSGLAFPVL